MHKERPATQALLTRRKSRSVGSHKEASLLSSRDSIQLLISQGCYHDALIHLLNSKQSLHWAHCRKAQIQFLLQHKRRALCSLRESFSLPRQNCTQCFLLLMHILAQTPALNDTAHDLIQFSLQCPGLPTQVRNFLSSEIKERNIDQVIPPFLDGDNFSWLLSYYSDRGARFESVGICARSKGYRVTVANKQIKPNQVIIFVPKNQIITLEIAKSHPSVRKLLPHQESLKSPKHTIFSLFLLAERNARQKSAYSTFIKSLPREISNFPIVFGEELLAELKGTSFMEIVQKKKEQILEDFNIVNSLLSEGEKLAYDDFIWSRMIISSRIFGIQINKIKTDALVPIADMLNHRNPKMTSWYFSDQKNGFIVENLSNVIPKGKEIYDSYGTKCNSRFLLNYGFVEPNNFFNQVIIQMKKYKNSTVMPPGFKLSKNPDNSDLKKMIHYYRKLIYLESNPEEYADFIGKKEVEFISNQNQEQVWLFLRENFKELLKRFPTSIKRDERILEDPALSFNLRNCIEIRLGEKKVVEYFLKMSEIMIKVFSSKRDAQIKVDPEYRPYLESLNLPFIKLQAQAENERQHRPSSSLL